ncbi:hypothetical protein ACJJTC_019363 [Scirpophaga incertulas]
MTAAVFHDFIKNVFYPDLIKNNISLPVILFVDGHKNHITREVSEICRRPEHTFDCALPKCYTNTTTSRCYCIPPFWTPPIKIKTLIHGFRVSGLYPFNANNVDYSKCLPSHNEDKVSEIEKEDTEINYKLNFEDFSKIVGLSIIRQCEDYNNSSPISCDYFKTIHKIWKKFKGLEENQYNVLYSQQKPPEEVYEPHEYYSEPDRVTEEIVSDLILDERTGEMRFDERTELNSEPRQENFLEITTVAEIHNHDSQKKFNQKIQKTKIKTAYCNLFERHETEEVKTRNQETGQKEQLNSDISQVNKLELRKIQPSNKQNIIITSNESLSDYLKKKMIPALPKRQGKRQTEKVPFALTSEYYIQMIKAKELKKLEDEAAKENRKTKKKNCEKKRKGRKSKKENKNR